MRYTGKHIIWVDMDNTAGTTTQQHNKGLTPGAKN